MTPISFEQIQSAEAWQALLTQAWQAAEPTVLQTSDGQRMVLIPPAQAEAFYRWWQAYGQRPLMPLDQLRTQFDQALTEAGYTTRAEVIQLVREVKREQAAEADTPLGE